MACLCDLPMLHQCLIFHGSCRVTIESGFLDILGHRLHPQGGRNGDGVYDLHSPAWSPTALLKLRPATSRLKRASSTLNSSRFSKAESTAPSESAECAFALSPSLHAYLTEDPKNTWLLCDGNGFSVSAWTTNSDLHFNLF